jgi:hypothetical protein
MKKPPVMTFCNRFLTIFFNAEPHTVSRGLVMYRLCKRETFFTVFVWCFARMCSEQLFPDLYVPVPQTKGMRFKLLFLVFFSVTIRNTVGERKKSVYMWSVIPNPGYGQLNPTELHKYMDGLGVWPDLCYLTLSNKNRAISPMGELVFHCLVVEFDYSTKFFLHQMLWGVSNKEDMWFWKKKNDIIRGAE